MAMMRKLLQLGLLLLLPTTALAQGVRYDNIALTRNGAPAPAATIAVCTQPAVTSTQPCSPLATAYTDSTLTTACTGTLQGPPASPGGAATSCSNPMVSDSLGNFHFYLAPGKYTFQYYGPQFTPFLAQDVILACDPTNCKMTGTLTVTGLIQCKNFESVRCVDTANSAGWTGTDACGWINSAIAALPTLSGFPVGVVDIRGLASTSTVTCGSTVFVGSPYLQIIGPGSAALIFNCTMTGDCVNSQEDHFGIAANIKGFRASGFSLVGQGATNANAVGWHFGDMTQGRVDDVQIENFNGTNSAGLWLENITYFSENNLFINVTLGESPGSGSSNQRGNTKDIRFSVNASGGVNNSSFARTHFVNLKYSTGANQTTVAMDGGAVYDQYWDIHGNTFSSTGSILIEMSGSTYPSSGANTFFNGVAIVQAECNCSGSGQFYSIPSGYEFDNFWGVVTGGTGFNYSTGMSGTLHNRINSSPLGTYTLTNYSAAGIPNNEYSLVINNPATNRNLSISDPLGNAAFVFDIATQTLTNKTLTSPTITSPTINTTSITGTPASSNLTATIASGTATMTTAAIGAGACGTTVTVVATNTATTDAIAWAFNAAPAANPAELVVSAWPTAGNVNFQYCNPTAGSVTPNAAILNWRVTR